MSAQRKLTVMVSSTFWDLQSHREKVIEAIGESGMHADVMENDLGVGLSDANDIKSSLDRVHAADIYLCVIGLRYGRRPACPIRNPDQLSLTELEYHHAERLNKPRIVFVVSDDHPFTRTELKLAEADNADCADKYDKFLTLVTSDRVVTKFTSPDDLKQATLRSLARHQEKAELARRPSVRPLGFQSIESLPTVGLSSYLRNEVLTYYGWDEHAKDHPPPPLRRDQVASESQLLSDLFDDPRPMVLAGEGGAGKTRLGYELCRAAVATGQWSSETVLSSARPEDADAIIQASYRDGKRLILFIESLDDRATPQDFDVFHELISRHPNGARLVVACRRSLLANSLIRPARMTDELCRFVDLSPADGSAYAQWLHGWRIETCRRILPDFKSPVPIDIPALAAIMAKARSSEDGGTLAGPDPEQRIFNLLENSVRNRIRDGLAFKAESMPRLLSCFPMSDELWARLSAEPEYYAMLAAWEADGWIRRASSHQGSWSLGHDILCDYPLMHHLASAPRSLVPRIKSLVAFASEHGGSQQLATALRRITSVLNTRLGVRWSFTMLHEAASVFAALNEYPENTLKVIIMARRSLSLDPAARMRVLFAAQTLSKFQIDSLEETFLEEAEKLRNLASQSPSGLAIYVIKAADLEPAYIKELMDEQLDPKHELVEVRKWIEVFVSEPALRDAALPHDKTTPVDVTVSRYGSLTNWLAANVGAEKTKRDFAARILWTSSSTVTKLGAYKEALAGVTGALDHYTKSDSANLGRTRTSLIATKAKLEAHLTYFDDAIATLTALPRSVTEPQDLPLRKGVALDLAYIAQTMSRHSRHQDALSVCSLMLKREENAREPELVIKNLDAINLGAIAYGSQAQPQKAREVLDHGIAIYGTHSSGDVQSALLPLRLSMIEMYIMEGNLAAAITAGRDATSYVSDDSHLAPILAFLRWICADPAVTMSDVFESVERSGRTHAWSFAEVTLHINTLPNGMRTRAHLFIDHLTGKFDIATLKARLEEQPIDTSQETDVQSAQLA